MASLKISPDNNLGMARVETLKSNDIISDVPAVKAGNYVLILSVIGQPEPSSADALEQLARAFHPTAFDQ